MKNKKMNRVQGSLILALFVTCAAAWGGEGFVAGLRPFERPVGAPVIVSFEQNDASKAKALRGVGEPQTGVGFLKDQGAWYTPFTRPNLLGRYDIRGLHNTDNKRD